MSSENLKGTHTLELDVHSNSYKTIGTCKQYNSGETVTITCYDDDNIINIDSSYTLELRVETPDGRHIQLSTNDIWQSCEATDVNAQMLSGYSQTIQDIIKTYYPDAKPTDYFRPGTYQCFHIDADKHTTMVELPESVFLESGKAEAEFVIIKGTQLTTMNFSITIIPAVFKQKQVVDDAFTTDEVTALKNYVNNCKELSKEWAIGVTGTGTEYPSDTNNSKYWSNKAENTLESKADQTVVNKTFKDISYDNTNGTFTFTFVDGTTKDVNTDLEKMAVNFDYDEATQKLTLTLEDGTTKEIDLSAFITETEYLDSDTIDFSITDHKLTAIVKSGSIEPSHIETEFLNEIRTLEKASQSYAIGGTDYRQNEDVDNSKYYKEQAAISATAAEQSIATTLGYQNTTEGFMNTAESYKDDAADSALLSQSWSSGNTGVRENENINNAKFWAEQAQNAAAITVAGGMVPKGTITFEGLPTITWNEDTHMPNQMWWMYNISDKFRSDERFEDGGGIKYNEGSNVYCTAQGKWDVLASATTSGGGIIVSDTEPEDQTAGSSWLKPKN